MGEDAAQAVTASSAGERKYVENGLLFFLNNKVNFMVHDDIIMLCNDFYGDEEVVEAKKIMYDEFKRPREAKSYRGANKKVNEIREMVNFLSENVSDNVLFCITRCTQVPPVSTDYIDVAAINRHVSLLRSEMSVMRATQRRFDAKLELLEAKPNTSTVQEDEPRREEVLVTPREEVKLFSEVVRKGMKEKKKESKMRKSEKGRKNEEEMSSDDSSSSSEWEEQRHQRRRTQRKQRMEMGFSRDLGQRQNGTQGHTDTRRRVRSAVIGRGGGGSLGAAPAVRDVALFVSRMPPETPVDHLVSHVRDIAGVNTVECEQLEQRYPNYRSYKVCIKAINKDKIKELYDPENWDSGLLVKRWYN